MPPPGSDWNALVAHMDQHMPDVAPWLDIERAVNAVADSWVRSHPLPLDFDRFLHHDYQAMWMAYLRQMYPNVARLVTGYIRGVTRLEAGANVHFIETFMVTQATVDMDDDANAALVMDAIKNEWRKAGACDRSFMFGYPEKTEARDRFFVLDSFSDSIIWRSLGAYDRGTTVDAPFRHALQQRIDTQARTHLAQSTLIDRLALRDVDAAQYLARFIAPTTITPRRPLLTREHARQLAELRATLSDLGRPEAVLARATRDAGGGRFERTQSQTRGE